MGAPSELKRGAVVLVRFPFSDLSASKLRPAIVLASVGRGDYVLAQVTSRAYGDEHAVDLTKGSFQAGSLERSSFVRPGKLFTANESLIDRQVAELSEEAIDAVVDAVIKILRAV